MNDKSNEGNAEPIVDAGQWNNFLLTRDETTGVAVLVRRSKKHRGYLYSMQLGSIREGDKRLAPYIPIFFDKDSLNMASDGPKLEHDYVEEITKLVTKAVLAALAEKKKEHVEHREAVVKRDLERAKRAPKNPVTRQELAAAKQNGAKRG